MGSIADNLQAVIGRIARAAVSSGRSPDEVCLLAVSKTWPASAVIEAVAAGQTAFGENYVQEGVDKILVLRSLGHLELRWHFIGPLQGNKTRLVAEHFDWVHSVGSFRHAERLSAQRPASLPALNVCIQVNISGEASKSGCAPDELVPLCRRISTLPGLRLRGLMAIPEPADDFAAQRAPLVQMKVLFDALREENPDLDTLSIGMSHDLEAAVSAGATMVRVGTAIFGQRENL